MFSESIEKTKEIGFEGKRKLFYKDKSENHFLCEETEGKKLGIFEIKGIDIEDSSEIEIIGKLDANHIIGFKDFRENKKNSELVVFKIEKEFKENELENYKAEQITSLIFNN